MANTLRDDVKTALRISHNKLDSEISDSIAAAKAELVRAGVSSMAVAETTDPLIRRAIITYCKAEQTMDPSIAEKYLVAFRCQADNLRKSPSYFEEDGTDE